MERSTSRAATYAETAEERAALKTSVIERGWSCSGREYGSGEWNELLADASKGRFDVICAAFDGLKWFAPVTGEVDYDRLLPKRATPTGPPKGGVIGGRAAVEEFAERLITDQGAQTLDEITYALMQSGLGTGSLGSVRNIVRFTLQASDRFRSRYDRDQVKRWRVKPQPTTETVSSAPVAPPSPTATTYALARLIAEELVRNLTNRSSAELNALLAVHDERSVT